MSEQSLAALRTALDERLEMLAEIGESDPQGIGVDHVELRRIGENTGVEELAARICTSEEWERLQRPDRSDRQTCARALTTKEACAKALGTGISEELEWQELEISRLSDRPFRVQCGRHSDRKLYASSGLEEGLAFAVAATFEN